MISRIFILCLTIVNIVQCKNEVPVLIWNSQLEQLDLHVPNAEKISASTFYENVLKKYIEKKPVQFAVFVEPSLSLEDFIWKDKDEVGVYPQVQKDFEINHFHEFSPYVSQPLDAFKSLAKDGYVITKFEDKKFPKHSRNVFIIELDDVKEDEDRPELLRRHDEIIHATCKSIAEKHRNTMCVLTASRTSWIEPLHLSTRKLLQAEPEMKQPDTSSLNVYHQPVGTIYTKSPPVLIDKKTNTSYNIVLDGREQITQSQLKENVNISVKTNAVGVEDNSPQKVTLIFVFNKGNSSYRLTHIQLIRQDNIPNNLEPTSLISTSIGYSFHTPSPVVFSNTNYNLTFANLQVELYKTPKAIPSFSVADDTVPFFTIPIWNGIFVSSILITIVLAGLSMIFDIKTMDQFDDPKGKTVTINATD